MIDPSLIENRNYGVVPLQGGLNFTDPKALVTPGTLEDTLNYEVVSKGYTRSKGLFLYNGMFDEAIDDMWWVTDKDALSTIVGSFSIGERISWTGGTGTCVYWEAYPGRAAHVLGIANIVGTLPSTALVFTGTGVNSFTVTITPTQLADAEYANNGDPVCATVTDYLTLINTVNTGLCSDSSVLWDQIRPRPLGLGAITGGFQFQDTVYVSRDFPGVGFTDSSWEPVFDDILTFNGFTAKVAQVKLTSGTYEAGNAAGVVYLKPYSAGTTSMTNFLSATTGTIINNSTTTKTTGLVNTAAHENMGHLWKATPNGWSYVDLGYSLRFKEGENTPNAVVAPLFTPSIAGVTSKIMASGFNKVSTATELGTPLLYIGWTGLANLTADDSSYASCVLAASEETKIIEAYSTSYVDTNNDAVVTGIEVKFEAYATTASQVKVRKVELVNVATGAVAYEGNNNKEAYVSVGGLPAVLTYGSQTDLWGFDSISIDDINNGDIRVRIQFDEGGFGGNTVYVDYISINVHYLQRGQKVYFRTPVSTNLDTTGFLYSYELHDGEFASSPNNTATGYMTLHDVTDPERITEDMYINPTATAGGNQIARTSGQLTRNLLPSEAELAAENSRWRSIRANFYQNEEAEGMFGVTGASPAFTYDKYGRFAFIRPPIDRSKDKPRHVAEVANHLVLGMKSGHILVSAVDVPNDFDTSGTATSWSFRDPITGLQPLAGNALGVMCRESIHALLGTQAPGDAATDPFRTQNVTPNTGAIEYTVCDAMGALYSDYSGVSRLETSDKFGDFEQGRMTEAVREWTRERLQRHPTANLSTVTSVYGMPFRAKNQYRLYFSDGYILNVYLGSSQRPPEIMLGHYDTTDYSDAYVPTWIDSSVLSTGRERVVMGDKNGNVWIVDGANGIQDDNGLTAVDCWVTTNPINSGYPQGASRSYSWTLLADCYGAQNITTETGYDYLPPDGTTTRTKSLGAYTNAPRFTAATEVTDIYTGTYTDGVSLKIATTMDGSQPHTLHTLIHRYSRKGSGRNNTTINRG